MVEPPVRANASIRPDRAKPSGVARVAAVVMTGAIAAGLLSCRSTPPHRTFPSPEQAVQALTAAVKAGNLDEVTAIFGSEGKELVDSSDRAEARRKQEVFTAAVAERWRLEDASATTKVLIIGNEEWPFPVPLTRDGDRWRYDTAAGREEVVARRIGRNELSAIAACHAYVVAQELYARRPHDGKPAGRYAARFRSEPGKQNGLYWPLTRGQRRSPLGAVLAESADLKASPDSGAQTPSPFHGYYFRILSGQGEAAGGGPKSYVVDGEMSAGHALVAWPARYDATGVMTFLVSRDGVVREKDLGGGTDGMVKAMSTYNPDPSWATVR